MFQGKTYVMYIQMKEARDFETWKQIAKVMKRMRLLKFI